MNQVFEVKHALILIYFLYLFYFYVLWNNWLFWNFHLKTHDLVVYIWYNHYN